MGVPERQRGAVPASGMTTPATALLVRTARAIRRALNVSLGTAAALLYRPGRSAPDADKGVQGPRVLLDGCVFQDPHTGIARLWRSVMGEWSESGFAKNVVVADRDGTAPRLSGFTYVRVPLLRAHDIRAERTMLERLCGAVRADVFVSTLYSYPTSTPSLLLVHDLTPEVLEWDLSAPVWRDKAAAVNRAAAFLCISESTKLDLHRMYPSVAGRPAAVALPGVDPSFAPSSAEDVAALRDKYALPNTFYVFVGHRDIHKNAELVFDAVALGPDIPEYGLLLLGGRPDLEPHFAEQAGETPVRIARLTDEELRTAYTGAAALLFPSRYEGFGLIALEAMACGCPVITCRNSAIPEAVDDAALFVGEDDPVGMARAMSAVLEPSTRESLVRKGYEWSAGFSWTVMADAAERAVREVADVQR